MAAKPKAKANAAKKRGGVTGKGFLPGQSDNPGGRPREVADLRAMAREADPAIMRNLHYIVEFGRWPNEKRKVSDQIRMVAHLTLRDRGWGKPLQGCEVKNIPPLPLIPITKQMTAQEASSVRVSAADLR
jgi:hypothetical protein